MATSKVRGEAAATPTSDDLTLERVQRWLKDQVTRLRRRGPQSCLPDYILPRFLDELDEAIDMLGSRLRAAQEAARHIRELDTLLVTFGPRGNPEPSAAPPHRRPATATAADGAPHNRERWRKRPLSEKERDDIRMDLLRARSAGEDALVRAKRETCERHGLSPKAVAGLLNTCTGKRFALNFAARVVSRAPQAQRQAQLIVQMSNLLGLKQAAIVQAVREIERD